jgi:hypothetical protein
MARQGKGWAATLCVMSVVAWPHATRAEPSTASPLLFRSDTSEPAGAGTGFVATAGGGLSELSEEARVWDDRLALGVRESYGRDVFDGRRVVTSRHLDQGANWQRQADFSFNALGPEQDVTLRVSGGVYDARRPTRVRRQRLRLGEVAAWGEHQGVDIGLNLGLFGDRLRYDGGYAWSDYVNRWDTREAARNSERRALSSTLEGAGDAQRHRIEADLLTGGAAELSAYGLYQAGHPNFRVGRRSGTSLQFTTGGIREIGTSLGLDGLRFGMTWQDRALRGLEQRTTKGEIAHGPFRLTLFQDVHSRAARGEWLSRDDSFGGEVEVDLDRHRYGEEEDGGFSIRRLLPSTVTLGAERGRRQHARAPDDPRDLETTHSLGLYWGWEWADTDMAIYRRVYDSRMRGAESADETEYGFDFSQGFYGESWDLWAYLSVGGFASHEIDNRWRDLWVGGGASISYYPEHLPDVSLTLDWNRYHSAMPDFAEHFGDQTLSLDLAVDLSKYLTATDSDHAPSMQLHYYVLGTDRRSSYSGRSAGLEHAIALTMALRF